MLVIHLNNVTSYEKLFDKRPDYTYLQCFGCLYFTSSPKHHRTKLEPRAHPCVFMKYMAATKGYKLINLVTQKIIVSRDVKFHERNFPFHTSKLPNVPTT